MYSELELDYKVAENLLESEISTLSDLIEDMAVCIGLLQNPLIWADEELTERLEARITLAGHLLADKERK